MYITSTLPVWTLLQPRDFINSYQLLLGLAILYAGLFLTNGVGLWRISALAAVWHSNQLLAGISLLLVTIWLKRNGRSVVYTLIPMVFLMFVTIWAMGEHVFFEWSGAGEADANLLLFFFGAIILGFAIWIILEAVNLLRRFDESIYDLE